MFINCTNHPYAIWSEVQRETSDGREYVAVIHADGNNLGITIGRLRSMEIRGTGSSSVRLYRYRLCTARYEFSFRFFSCRRML
ncbi:MAG: hypothetical protein J6O50_05865 [Ruminiclostridium sp.]|nr:hypothetical protein [Ruminiclostridium sp.]